MSQTKITIDKHADRNEILKLAKDFCVQCHDPFKERSQRSAIDRYLKYGNYCADCSSTDGHSGNRIVRSRAESLHLHRLAIKDLPKSVKNTGNFDPFVDEREIPLY